MPAAPTADAPDALERPIVGGGARRTRRSRALACGALGGLRAGAI